MLLAGLRFITKVLPVIAGLATAAGLLLAAALKNTTFTDHIMPLYPRYQLAQEGFNILQDFKYSVPNDKGEQQPVAVLEIDNPAWPVILDFVQSEISFRKSERNEPGPALFTPEAPADAKEKPKPIELPAIDFGRVKTIFTMKFSVVSAGPKPLSPPFGLMVLWPSPIPRRVYEFLSFKEFELDLRQMLVQELEFRALVVSFFAFLAQILLIPIGWLLRRIEKQLAPKRTVQTVESAGSISHEDA